MLLLRLVGKVQLRWTSPPSVTQTEKNKQIVKSRCPWARHLHLNLLLNFSVAAAGDMCRAAPSVTVWRCVEVKQAESDKEYICVLFLCLRWWGKTTWTNCLLIRNPVTRRFYLLWPEWCMMGPGGRYSDTHQYVCSHFSTPHTDTASFYLSFIQALC